MLESWLLRYTSLCQGGTRITSVSAIFPSLFSVCYDGWEVAWSARARADLLLLRNDKCKIEEGIIKLVENLWRITAEKVILIMNNYAVRTSLWKRMISQKSVQSGKGKTWQIIGVTEILEKFREPVKEIKHKNIFRENVNVWRNFC